ncbi:glycosyltransferase family 9 protein [Kaistia defluvii]|uniref:ADP-heptose:LPS heptosyltransferase n=1 Tax=Kaistia defluvii TaxID=410841 RepID=A0ABV2QTE0_9HYPH
MKKVLAEFRRFSRRVAAIKQARQIAKDIRERRQDAKAGLLPKVAIRVTGGIGDHIVAARFLRDLLAAAGPLAFDVYSPKREVAAWIFQALDAPVRCFNERILWDRLRPDYVLSLYVTQFAVVYADTADWQYLSEHAPRLFEICVKLEEFRPRIETCVQNHPLLDGHLGRIATFMGFARRNFLQGMAGIPYGGDMLALDTDPDALVKFGLAGKRYITVHNGFDAEFDKASLTSTKVYSEFSNVISQTKRLFPDLLVIQVGTSTSRPIPSADMNLIGATNLRELAAIIKNSWLNLDNESGVVHLASCFDVRSCVVFGPTSLEYYAYPQNINLPPPVCGGCWWVNEDWMNRCAKGHEQAPCMSQQSPETVVVALRDHLSAWYAEEQDLPERAPFVDADGATSAEPRFGTRLVVDGMVRFVLGTVGAWVAIGQLIA